MINFGRFCHLYSSTISGVTVIADNFDIFALFQVLFADSFGILAIFQVLIADSFGILALLQVFIAETFGILALFQALIADNFCIVNTLKKNKHHPGLVPMISGITSHYSSNCAINQWNFYTQKETQ